MITLIDVAVQRFVGGKKKDSSLFSLSFPFSSSKTCGFVFFKCSRDYTHPLGGP